MSYSTQFEIHFNHVDPAGWAYFSRAIEFAHSCYEKMVVEHLGYEWGEWFSKDNFVVPIRHCEADYFVPLKGGQTYTVTVHRDQLSNSSATLKYRIHRKDKTHCVVTLVHVFVDPATGQKMSIPEDVREKLMNIEAFNPA